MICVKTMMTDVAPPYYGANHFGLFSVIGGIVCLMSALIIIVPTALRQVPDPPQGVLAAFLGCEGYGCETTHARGGTVCIVTNTNSTGAGSFRDCLGFDDDAKAARFIIFRVAGTIQASGRWRITNVNDNVAIFCNTAPGGGIAFRGKAAPTVPLLQLGRINNASVSPSNVLIQGCRFRQGMPDAASSGESDNLIISNGANHIVIDHNSFTWSGDETVSAFDDNIHDITFSHNLFAEGTCAHREGSLGSDCQNAGPYLSGGDPHYNISLHNNALIYVSFRAFKIDSGNGSTAGARGYVLGNNIHYDQSVLDHSFHHNQSTGTTPLTIDVIADYFKEGPDTGSITWPVTVSRETGTGGWADASLHLEGSTWRLINGTDHPNNDEANNYTMVKETNVGFGAMDWVQRPTPIVERPEHEINFTTADNAYVRLIEEGDVGALPHDSVDTRIVGDPEDGGGWSAANVPGPFGTCGPGCWPTLTGTAPTDTDSDGVPDGFEVTLGTDPNVFEQQGQLDHDGDGYMNIEEWVQTCPPYSATACEG